MIQKTTKEIEEQIDKATGWCNAGATDVRSMSYEDGVKIALEWVLGQIEEEPIENEYMPEEDKEE